MIWSGWETRLLAGVWVESETCDGLFHDQKRNKRISPNCLEIKLRNQVIWQVCFASGFGQWHPRQTFKEGRCQNHFHLSAEQNFVLLQIISVPWKEAPEPDEIPVELWNHGMVLAGRDLPFSPLVWNCLYPDTIVWFFYQSMTKGRTSAPKSSMDYPPPTASCSLNSALKVGPFFSFSPHERDDAVKVILSHFAAASLNIS